MWENIKLTLKGSVNDYDNHDDFNDTAADDDGNVDGGGIDNDDGNNDSNLFKSSLKKIQVTDIKNHAGATICKNSTWDTFRKWRFSVLKHLFYFICM